MAALIRSESMTNLPVEDVEDEDIRLTWRSKARKVASLSGSYIVKFDDILLHEKPEQDAGSAIPAEPLVVESQTFLLCGNWWSVLLYPFGCDEDGEYLAVRLQNKSEDQVNAYYAISIKKSMSSEDNNRLNFWVDPDTDSLVFKPYGHQDDSWGVDDFIALKDLHNRELEMTYMNFYAPVEVLKTEEEEGEGGGDTENKDNEKKEEKEKEKEKIAGVAESKTQGEIKPKKETDKEKEKAPKSPGKHNRRTMRQRQKQEEHDEKSKKLEVQLQPMTDENGKRITDRLVLEIQMLSFGEVMLKQHPFTQAIEQKNATEDQLVALAEEDLALIKTATKGGGMTLDQLSHRQDLILSQARPDSPIGGINTNTTNTNIMASSANMEGGLTLTGGVDGKVRDKGEGERGRDSKHDRGEGSPNRPKSRPKSKSRERSKRRSKSPSKGKDKDKERVGGESKDVFSSSGRGLRDGGEEKLFYTNDLLSQSEEGTGAGKGESPPKSPQNKWEEKWGAAQGKKKEGEEKESGGVETTMEVKMSFN